MPEQSSDPAYHALKARMDSLEEKFKTVEKMGKTLGITIAQMRTHQFTAQPLAESIAIAQQLSKCGYADIEERAKAFVTKWSGACFIATACYGSMDDECVIKFRKLRDERLMQNPWGRLAVASYYRLSPPMAKWLLHKPLCRLAIRKYLLDPIASRLGTAPSLTPQ